MRTPQSEKFGRRLVGSLEKGTAEGARKAWEVRRRAQESSVASAAPADHAAAYRELGAKAPKFKEWFDAKNPDIKKGRT